MADNSNSPAFTPPMNNIRDKDPQIIKVPMEKVDFGFRQSQAPAMDDATGGIVHVPNGR